MSEEKKCVFCRDYELAMAQKKTYKKEDGINLTVKVSLCEYGRKNRLLIFKHVNPSRQLNYCPTCGEKLKRGY